MVSNRCATVGTNHPSKGSEMEGAGEGDSCGT